MVSVKSVGAAVISSVLLACSAGLASADSTALLVGGSGIPQWNDEDSGLIIDRLIDPTHPGTNKPVAVRTPSEIWPLGSYLGPVVCPLICQGSVFDNPWPDAPLWKISGLFDLTFDQSVRAGQGDLEAEIAKHPDGSLVIYGYSQGAMVVNREKRKLADEGVERDIDFVLSGDPNLPNGGLAARFPGLYIPILDFTFNGSAPTDTSFDTISITRQYDPVSDFPLYPINLLADVNALVGFFYVHLYPLDVDLANPEGADVTTYDDTTFYYFPSENLPLFGPLRTLGVPEPVIDVVEPFVKVLVETGYDRGIPLGEPTPARLIPPLNPVQVTSDLVHAVGEGFQNAVNLVVPPKPVTTLADTDEPETPEPKRPKLRERIQQTIAGFGTGRNEVRASSAAHPERKTPVRDAIKHARTELRETVSSVKTRSRGGQRD